MTRVLILGANGQLARHTTAFFLKGTDATLTLFLRNARRLKNPDPKRATIIDGDVTDRAALLEAMQGQDVVYANLSGDMAKQARLIVDAMHASGAETAHLHQFHGYLWRGSWREISPRAGSLPRLCCGD